MNTLLAATTLDDSLQGIVTKLQSLMDSFWIYIVMALAAVVVIWGAYVGIKIAIAHKNEEKNQCPRYGQEPYYRYHYHLRNRYGRTPSHQRLVRLGGLKNRRRIKGI